MSISKVLWLPSVGADGAEAIRPDSLALCMSTQSNTSVVALDRRSDAHEGAIFGGAAMPALDKRGGDKARRRLARQQAAARAGPAGSHETTAARSALEYLAVRD